MRIERLTICRNVTERLCNDGPVLKPRIPHLARYWNTGGRKKTACCALLRQTCIERSVHQRNLATHCRDFRPMLQQEIVEIFRGWKHHECLAAGCVTHVTDAFGKNIQRQVVRRSHPPYVASKSAATNSIIGSASHDMRALAARAQRAQESNHCAVVAAAKNQK